MLDGAGHDGGVAGPDGGAGLEEGGEAAAEAVGPVRDGQAEGGLDLSLVEDGVGGALDGAGVLLGVAGLDVAGGAGNSSGAGLGGDAGAGLGGEFVGQGGDGLGEVEPGADAFVAVVVGAVVGVRFFAALRMTGGELRMTRVGGLGGAGGGRRGGG